MREIKFRNMVYREQCKDWVTYFYTLEDLVENSDMDVFENVWEQYTGLKDKNGKEIYEGDVVSYTTCYYGKERKRTKAIQWAEWTSDDFGMPYNVGFFDVDSSMEVIGNIHENPELLGGEK